MAAETSSTLKTPHWAAKTEGIQAASRASMTRRVGSASAEKINPIESGAVINVAYS